MSLFRRKRNSELDEDFFYQYPGSGEDNPEAAQGEFLGTFLSSLKLFILFGFLSATLVFILGRSFYLQVVKGAYYQQMADNNRSTVEYLHATRGLIYDSKGVPLVANQPKFALSLVPADLPFTKEARQQRLNEIATMLGLDTAGLTKQLADLPLNFKQPVTIKEELPYQEALAAAIKIEGHPELALESVTQRQYLDPEPFAHIFGYLGKINKDELKKNSDSDYLFADNIGKSGLELTYENNLRGANGLREVEVDAQGHEKKVIYQKDAVRGQNLILTIDKKLQDTIYHMTRDHLRQIGKTKAAVIVEQPQTGAILAFVSYPSLDNNMFISGLTQDEYTKLVNDPAQPLFNRAIKGEYPSGSTIKMIVGGGALEEHVISESTTFLSTGGIWIDNLWFFPDWKAGGHGITNIYKALADSVNTFFYIVGGGYQEYKGLGAEKLAKYYRLFGLGSPTGVDLPSESAGLVPDANWKQNIKKEQWYIGDTYHMAIGQGDVLVTPLQVANYTSAFANGGKLVTPHFVDSMVDENNHQTQIVPANIRTNMIDSYNVGIIRKGLRRAVTDGSARYMNSLPVQVAGKTGTAQFADNKEPHAWFTGFAPYDKPEIVVTVLIEEGGEGSSTAVPLAYKIMNYYFGEYKKAANPQS